MEHQSDTASRSASAEISLLDLWRVIWSGKILIVAVTGSCVLLAVAYALLATEWYRAETLLVPAENSAATDLGGQLVGLAALAGIPSRSASSNTTESLAVLRSRGFAREFIRDLELLNVLLGQEGQEHEEILDIRDAVKFFHDNVLRVSEDRDTGQVRVAVEWLEPAVAAEWANTIVLRLNSRMRDRALQQAEANIEYLRSEIVTNEVITLDQTISRVMEGEMQKLMLARGNEEFAFRVIDHAEPPRKRSRPRRSLIVATVLVVSGILSILIVFARAAIRSASSMSTPAS